MDGASVRVRYGFGGRWVRRRVGAFKGKISTSRYHKRPRRIVARMSKIRWIWWRRYHTTSPWVWSEGMFATAPAIRAAINEQLLRGLTTPGEE